MRVKLAFAVVLCALLSVAAVSAKADTFNISWTGAYGTGSGTLTATDLGSGEFLMTSLDATQNGLLLTLLVPGTYGANDNDTFPFQAPQLDVSGFSFSDGTAFYNVYNLPGTLSYFECVSTATACFVGDGAQLETFNITPTPEPATALLLGTGLLALFGSRRKRAIA